MREKTERGAGCWEREEIREIVLVLVLVPVFF